MVPGTTSSPFPNEHVWLFFGPPGAGKTTASAAVRKAYGFEQTATGDLIRDSQTPILINDESVIPILELPSSQVMHLLIQKTDDFMSKGKDLIVEGLEDLNEYEEYTNYLKKKNINFRVFIFEADLEGCDKRLEGRLACKKCKQPYNDVSYPPNEKGKCDDDGEVLYRRESDKSPKKREEHRKSFKETTSKIIELCRTSTPQPVIIDTSGSLKDSLANLSKVFTHKQFGAHILQKLSQMA